MQKKKKIRKLNISSKPFKLKHIAKKFFKIDLKSYKKYRKINMRSIYGKHDGKYFISQKKTLKDLNFFLNKL